MGDVSLCGGEAHTSHTFLSDGIIFLQLLEVRFYVLETCCARSSQYSVLIVDSGGSSTLKSMNHSDPLYTALCILKPFSV